MSRFLRKFRYSIYTFISFSALVCLFIILKDTSIDLNNAFLLISGLACIFLAYSFVRLSLVILGENDDRIYRIDTILDNSGKGLRSFMKRPFSTGKKMFPFTGSRIYIVEDKAYRSLNENDRY
ncbi:hypothetical protein CUJ83_00305 [Methanocella sp. CWC-04]|uniref:Uncharacterized protein n=1 Tax=Methanooceanicella nereidis TaxID=2052831 RepID=A0AAP2RAA5_9EURY|nr:hypothetical protein [Methanocella sp. CWC-04]MCD1293439.1 hypothetical protein [Methanocella sp. CWC-04]